MLSGFLESGEKQLDEAASLAKLPKEAATQKVASLILALPGQLLTSPDRGATATRLIALLPRRSDSRPSKKPTRATAADAEVVALRRRVIIAGMIFVSYMMLLVGAHLATSRDGPSTQANTADAPASPDAPSQTPPPLFRKVTL